MSQKRHALLILRTPFQAWLAQRVLIAEEVSSFDLVYLTQNNSIEDRYYFSRLQRNALKAQYCYVPPQRPDILNHLAFRIQTNQWYGDKNYELVMLASIDALVPSSLSAHHTGELITFDDGSANISAASSYRADTPSLRTSIYRKLFGARSVSAMCNRVLRHYTLHPDLENIVGHERLVAIKGWGTGIANSEGGLPKKFFIGQPLSTTLSIGQLEKLSAYMFNQNLHYYIRHPRESTLVFEGTPLLDKKGRIAEDAILNASKNTPVHVLGWFSSTLLNLRQTEIRRTMVLFRDDSRTPSMADLGRRTGCEIVLI